MKPGFAEAARRLAAHVKLFSEDPDDDGGADLYDWMMSALREFEALDGDGIARAVRRLEKEREVDDDSE